MSRPIILLCAFAVLSLAQNPAANWERLQFLTGKWKGTGTGQPGAGQGAFSFTSELNGQILVRRSFNQLANGPRHEDLMIIYMDGKAPRAIYFDSENHVIKYDIRFPASNTAVFESDDTARYRLTYTLEGANLNGTFEAGGKKYLTWSSVRE